MTDRPSFLGQTGPDGKRLPASIRYNNSGAQYPGKVARKFGSRVYKIIGGGHKIAVFPDAVAGAAAHFALLASPIYAGGKRKRTVRQCIKKWCGGYSPSVYARVVKDKGGVDPDEILTRQMLENPEVAIPIVKAMAWQEAGRDYPLEDLHWEQAHAMAFGADAAPVPVPPAKELRKRSRKYRLTDFLSWLSGLFGIGGGGAWLAASNIQSLKAYADTMQDFSQAYGFWAFMAVCVGIAGFAGVMKYFMRQDIEEGRYEPSADWTEFEDD